MVTINASSGAYRIILKRKQKMEEKARRLLPIAKALDALLGVNEVDGKEDGR